MDIHSYVLATLGVQLHGFPARFDVKKEMGVEPCAGLYVDPCEDFVIAGRHVLEFIAPILIGSAIVEAVAAYPSCSFMSALLKVFNIICEPNWPGSLTTVILSDLPGGEADALSV